MNLEPDRHMVLMLSFIICIAPILSIAEDNSGLIIAVGKPISLTDVDISMPIEYSKQKDDVIIRLRYPLNDVHIQIFGDGTVRGERNHNATVPSTNGVFTTMQVKHTFTTQLSEVTMKQMLMSMTGLINFDLPAVKKELSESPNCWRYCTDLIISHKQGVTSELEINLLKYTLKSGDIVEGTNKSIKWDKTDIFEAAAKFPRNFSLQDLKGRIEEIMGFCDCLPSHN